MFSISTYVVKLNWFKKFGDREGPLKKLELAAIYCQALIKLKSPKVR